MNKSEVEHKADFSLIRYAQCWEDADILLDALDIKEGDTCLSIASAGDNALAMLTRNPAKVIALDLSQAQLECLALRVAAYRNLDHEELLELMGSKPSKRRETLFQKCLPSLKPETVTFWQAQMKEVEKYGIAGVGKFENYFRLFKDYVHPLVHSHKVVNDLLQDKPTQERHAFYARSWDTWRWRLLLKFFFSKQVMGKHGRDKAFFDYVEDSVPAHVGRRTEYALSELNPAENPYLQWILTGQHKTALPCALRKENFDIIRNNLNRLEWRRQSVEDFAASGEKADAFNLSDIFEYMSEEVYEGLYRKLLESANSGARFAYWNMMVPRFVPKSLQDQVIPKTELAEKLFAKDKAFFYSRFVLEEAA